MEYYEYYLIYYNYHADHLTILYGTDNRQLTLANYVCMALVM